MKRQAILFLFLFASSITYGQNSTNIYTTDIDNFWNAYDSIKTTFDTIKQLHFIQTLYLDKASDGLKDFMKLREHSAKRHLSNILKYPKFWTSVRSKTLEIKSHSSEIEKIISNFQVLFSNFKAPKIYFTIGVLNSGGTTSPDKILIGSEIACSDKTVDASELNNWLQAVFRTSSSVVATIAHELVHTQQRAGSSGSLLAHCIREGACDFIAELIYKPINSPYMSYGTINEKNIWSEFKNEMLRPETKKWLYNGDNSPIGVADLGYFIGYKICKSFYDKTKNKRKALKLIIELNGKKNNAIKFLQNSNYDG